MINNHAYVVVPACHVCKVMQYSTSAAFIPWEDTQERHFQNFSSLNLNTLVAMLLKGCNFYLLMVFHTPLLVSSYGSMHSIQQCALYRRYDTL